MILAKTEKGRAALSERRALTPRDRQLIVLADGERDITTLSELIGIDVEDAVVRLITDGYLMRVTPILRDTADFSHTGTIEFAPSMPPRETANAAAPAPSRPAGASRRSMTASKMYMIGLLQMMRDLEASSLAVSMHTARDEPELRHWMVGALVHLYGHSGPEFAARVAARLLEVYPEDSLSLLCDDIVMTRLPTIAVLAIEMQQERGEMLEAG